ncbi:hypothetical protein MMC30_005302 [Trapelia coarctata]|nr:hypothetical protein [Trapelia coarctata]
MPTQTYIEDADIEFSIDEMAIEIFAGIVFTDDAQKEPYIESSIMACVTKPGQPQTSHIALNTYKQALGIVVVKDQTVINQATFPPHLGEQGSTALQKQLWRKARINMTAWKKNKDLLRQEFLSMIKEVSLQGTTDFPSLHEATGASPFEESGDAEAQAKKRARKSAQVDATKASKSTPTSSLFSFSSNGASSTSNSLGSQPATTASQTTSQPSSIPSGGNTTPFVITPIAASTPASNTAPIIRDIREVATQEKR